MVMNFLPTRGRITQVRAGVIGREHELSPAGRQPCPAMVEPAAATVGRDSGGTSWEGLDARRMMAPATGR
jgi:hypothetical protein